MIIIGLTGGIGSGKSTVARLFSEKGIPVYNSDNWAKWLINNQPTLKNELVQLFGEDTYLNGVYNSAFVSSKVFNNPDLLKQLNSIVHPAVFKHFKNWLETQDSIFVVKEAAILFESGSWKNCDIIISVISEVEIRIGRVIKRDNLNRDQILSRMNHQWSDKDRIEKSDFVIENNSDLLCLKNEFETVYKKLLEKYGSR